MTSRKEYCVEAVQFGVLNPEEAKRMAVIEITSGSLYQQSLPKDGGINSLEMGTCNNKLRCKTCRNNVRVCPGHFGYLELKHPCYHPCHLDSVVKILRCCCFWCSSLLVEKKPRKKTRPQTALTQISSSAKGKQCPECGGKQPSYAKNGMYIKADWGSTSFETEEEEKIARRPFSAQVAFQILQDMSDEDVDYCRMDPASSRPEHLILTTLMIPPPIIRPSVQVQVGSRTRGQEDLTLKLMDIQKANVTVGNLIGQQKDYTKALDSLQLHICLYMDKDSRSAQVKMQSKNKGGPRTGPTRSLVMRLSGKHGRIRGNCMGKLFWRCVAVARLSV